MKEFIYYLKTLIGLLLLSVIAGISVGVIFDNNTYAIYTVSSILTLGFIGIVVQLYHSQFSQTPQNH